jgi:nucleotide-binding universal stress UspA family protein
MEDLMSKAPLVVGLDESTTAERALAWAVAIAERHQARVEAVHVWRWHHPSFGLIVPDVPAAVAASALASVQAQVEKVVADRPAGAAAVEVTSRAPEGDPPVALLVAAADAGLLVLGRHGQGSGLRRLVEPGLGSIASYCLKHSDVPVAIVPPATSAAPPTRVVVGVDGSTSSAMALRWAVSEAQVLEVPVVAVLTWQMTTVPAPETARAAGPVPPLTEWEAVARGLLDETVDVAVTPEEAAGVQRVLLHRRPAGGLLDFVQTSDLLVLGKRGHGGFDRLLLGSVSRQCAEHSACPVVIVPERVRSLTPPGPA